MVTVCKSVYVDVDIEIGLKDLTKDQRAALAEEFAGPDHSDQIDLTSLHAAFALNQNAVIEVARKLVYQALGRIV